MDLINLKQNLRKWFRPHAFYFEMHKETEKVFMSQEKDYQNIIKSAFNENTELKQKLAKKEKIIEKLRSAREKDMNHYTKQIEELRNIINDNEEMQKALRLKEIEKIERGKDA